jgi:hypothetical protein
MPQRRRSKPQLSLAPNEWPEADRLGWEQACRPGASRLRPGGRASHLAEASRDNLKRRYGGFLHFLRRIGLLEMNAAAAALVTPANVQAYVKELIPRVLPVSVYTYICCLRQTAQLLAPVNDFSWLVEIERDLALEVEPRSKFDRFVLTERLVEAGLALVIEAMESSASDVARAVRVRNGLAIALLAVCPIRIKNFAALEIGTTFKAIDGKWWIICQAPLQKIAGRMNAACPTGSIATSNFI